MKEAQSVFLIIDYYHIFSVLPVNYPNNYDFDLQTSRKRASSK